MTAGIEEFVARGVRPGRRWRAALRRPLAVLPLGYLALLVAGSVLAPVLAPYSPVTTDLDHVLAGPGAAHPLGTDALGRDVLSRLMYGGQVSLLHAAIVVVTVIGVGVTSGIAAGYLDGWFDRAFTWVVDVLLAIPVLMTLLVVLAVVGEHQTVVMVALGVLVSPGLARVVRGATLAVRKELYVAAARVCGLPHHRIVTAHVLPADRRPDHRPGLPARRRGAAHRRRPELPRVRRATAGPDLGRHDRPGGRGDRPPAVAAGAAGGRARPGDPGLRPARRRRPGRDRRARGVPAQPPARRAPGTRGRR